MSLESIVRSAIEDDNIDSYTLALSQKNPYEFLNEMYKQCFNYPLQDTNIPSSFNNSPLGLLKECLDVRYDKRINYIPTRNVLVRELKDCKMHEYLHPFDHYNWKLPEHPVNYIDRDSLRLFIRSVRNISYQNSNKF